MHRTGTTDAEQRIPRNASRFEIESVDDTSASFQPYEAGPWLRRGTPLYAVDPARRDALVARLRVVRTEGGRVQALVESQVTRVRTTHVILAIEPTRKWYRAPITWLALLVGGGIGAVAAR